MMHSRLAFSARNSSTDASSPASVSLLPPAHHCGILDWLLSRRAFSHRFITMNEHRQQSALALQPKLVNIVLNLTANTEVINQNMCAIRQRLLMQADMAVGIHIDDCQRVIAQTQQLVGYLRGITR